MTSGQKVAVSLLISVVIFAAFAVAAFAGLFSVIEARFYQPLVVKNIEQRLEEIAAKETEYTDILARRFESYATNKAVASYASAVPSSDDQKKKNRFDRLAFCRNSGIARNPHY